MINLEPLHPGHERILDLIALAETAGVSSANGRALLESLEQELLDHLREEEHGHLHLWRLSRGNGGVRREVRRSHEALVGVAMAAVAFFHLRHHPGASDGMETAFISFKNELRTRIEQEEGERSRLFALLRSEQLQVRQSRKVKSESPMENGLGHGGGDRDHGRR